MIRLFTCLLLVCAFAVPSALTDTTPIPLHKGLSGQDRIGRLVWRGGIEMNREDPRFGGISAMEIDPGGRTLTMLTDRGHRAELFLEDDLAGDLSGAKLVDLEPVIGAVGRSIEDDRNSDNGNRADREAVRDREFRGDNRAFGGAWTDSDLSRQRQ
jgi:hypothetical protein